MKLQRNIVQTEVFTFEFSREELQKVCNVLNQHMAISLDFGPFHEFYNLARNMLRESKNEN